MIPQTHSHRAFVLWLVFSLLPGCFFALPVVPADTIILDGEVIYISPREVMVNMDSLEQELRRDTRSPSSPGAWRVSVNVLAGLDRTHIGSSAGDFESLDAFTGRSPHGFPAPMLCAAAGRRVNGWLEIEAGVGWAMHRMRWRSLDERALAPEANRIRFENRGGELWQYATYEVGPGFETDTSRVPIEETVRTRSVLFLPLVATLHMPVSSRGKRGRISLGLGVHAVIPLAGGRPGEGLPDAYLVNSSGEFMRVDVEGSERNSASLQPIVQIGFRKALGKKWEWQAGAGVRPLPWSRSQNGGWEAHTRTGWIGAGLTRVW